MTMLAKILAKVKGPWYHGSKKPLTPGKLTKIGDWTAFDGKKIDRPIWLTLDASFAKLNGQNVYECDCALDDKDIFNGELLTTNSEPQWWKHLTPLGDRLYDALQQGLFPDDDDAEGLFKAVWTEKYSIIETKAMLDWLQSEGFKGSYIVGDGPRNLIVFAAENVEIKKRIPS